MKMLMMLWMIRFRHLLEKRFEYLCFLLLFERKSSLLLCLIRFVEQHHVVQKDLIGHEM